MFKVRYTKNAVLLLTLAFLNSGINFLLYRSFVGGIILIFLSVCFVINVCMYYKSKREKINK